MSQPDPAQTHDDNAEQALLGAMLLSPQTVAAAIAILNPADLYRPHHQTIWSAIVESEGWGDAVIVEAELRRRRQLTKTGGPTYLLELMRACPVPGPDHIGYYAKIIRDCAAARRRHQLALQLRDAVDQPETWAKLLQAAHDSPSTPNGATGRLRVTSASTIEPRRAHWLDTDQRIPANAITLLAGREGIGKTTIAYDLVAKLTRGQLGDPEPRAAAIAASEEAWHETVIPRLIAAGADRTRVYRVDVAEADGRHGSPISTPADLPELEQICPELDIALLVIDPIMSVIHPSLDTHKDREVRQALDPLSRFAATGVAVLALIHANKANTSDPLNSIMGSRAFTAVSRSVLYCITDPQAEREDRYLYGHVKCNQGPKQPTLAYHLVNVTLDEWDIPTSRVIWDQSDKRLIGDVMATPRSRPDSEPASRILDWLAERGPHPSVTAEIAEAFPDIKPATLRQHLSRLVERGKLIRPQYGHYRLPLDSEP